MTMTFGCLRFSSARPGACQARSRPAARVQYSRMVVDPPRRAMRETGGGSPESVTVGARERGASGGGGARARGRVATSSVLKSAKEYSRPEASSQLAINHRVSEVHRGDRRANPGP